MYRLKYKPYVLHFTKPIRMARGVIRERKGIILQLSTDYQTAYSDLLPLTHFGTESLEDALAFLKDRNEVAETIVDEMPEGLVASRFALETALFELSEDAQRTEFYRAEMPLSKLLPSDERMNDVFDQGFSEGYRIFKVKIALREFQDEWKSLQALLNRFPDNVQLRIDANEGLSEDQAKRWLEVLEGFPVEFIEQPLPRVQIEETIRLTEQFTTPVALDESIATTEDMIRCHQMGFRGVFACKPLRLGALRMFLGWRERSDARISYSTVFETAIGSLFGVKLAASDPRNTFGLGYGVSHWMEEKELLLPSKPLYRTNELRAFDQEQIWQSIERND